MSQTRVKKVVGIRGASPPGVLLKDAGVIAELEHILRQEKDENVHGIVVGYR